MTTETILTEFHIDNIAAGLHGSRATPQELDFARAIEQAVLQSDQIRNMQGMADCMDMVRQELIEAGIIKETVPPMMVANAVLAEIQALRKDAARLDKLEADYFEPVEGGIRKHIDADMEQQNDP